MNWHDPLRADRLEGLVNRRSVVQVIKIQLAVAPQVEVQVSQPLCRHLDVVQVRL